ncbi:hypothetical protein SAMD00019534_036530 [Acytostelium subglobosum LB1]|uniref:hypothetical protein n=1 Tax=Acytostelium subglobosum LB1 TaxID=1410327 RepID=UPI000644E1F6|nr:hypothetical protein SAMD00019534_036530 [Acytostelium subglobosum LB1]GAM20478.1 hypothetical protein SAMD00019534_036530 [Acytostelium subglobosum LB1]|eukprot:XP_012759999.1 hypothetical protein SAMD00019534_036530 [Acytostelium subglobosum LB1]
MCDYYRQAAGVIDKLLQKKGSIKGLSFQSSNSESNSKTAYALVCETLKYKDTIDELLTTVQGLKDDKTIGYSLLLVMLYELMFGANQSIKGGGHAKKSVMAYKVQLSAALARLKIRRQVANNVDLLPESIRNPILLPRYVRVNTNVCQPQHVIDHFVKNEAYTLNTANTYCTKLDYGVDAKTFFQDQDFPSILVFAPNVDLHDHPLLLSGHIILQDKASCLPAFVLNPPENTLAIDSCSAPGNKTSLLSALMKNTGRIYAIEKDAKRMGTLVKLTGRSRCNNIQPLNKSFFDLDHSDPRFKNVEYVLCDPSCSGSGIVNRLDHLLASTTGGSAPATAEENDDIEDLIREKGEQAKKNGGGGSKKQSTNTLDKDAKKPTRKEKKEQAMKRKLEEMKQSKSKGKDASKDKSGDASKDEEEVEVMDESQRLALLADFQFSIIMHAFQFPCVKRVVYSTCSVHQVENEDVVKRALDELNCDGEKWRLANILPHWNKSRGLSLFKNSEYCLRMSPASDNTIGFFVACFEKINPTPINPIEARLPLPPIDIDPKFHHQHQPNHKYQSTSTSTSQSQAAKHNAKATTTTTNKTKVPKKATQPKSTVKGKTASKSMTKPKPTTKTPTQAKAKPKAIEQVKPAFKVEPKIKTEEQPKKKSKTGRDAKTPNAGAAVTPVAPGGHSPVKLWDDNAFKAPAIDGGSKKKKK